MDAEQRKAIVDAVSEKWGIEPARLEELLDERDHDYGLVTVEDAEKALGLVAPRGGATFFKPGPSSFFPGAEHTKTYSESGSLAADIRVHTSREGDVQFTERSISPARLAGYAGTPEPMIATPVLPGQPTPVQLPENIDRLTPQGKHEAAQRAVKLYQQQAMHNQAPSISQAVAAVQSNESLAAYLAEHPDYDVAQGTPQVPTPELYKDGGLAEELFGVDAENMPAMLSAQRHVAKTDAEQTGDQQDGDHGDGQQDERPDGGR